MNLSLIHISHCGITVRAVQGGGIRCAYHHSACVESWFMNTPGLVVVCPTTPYEAKGMLISAIKSDNPVLFLEHKTLYNVKGEVPQEMYELSLIHISPSLSCTRQLRAGFCIRERTSPD